MGLLNSTKTKSYEDVVKEYGAWTSFNVEYSPGKFTMANDNSVEWPIRRSNYFGFQAESILNKPLSEMRILDLGCLEGSLTYHLARMGARESVGLEAREMNLAKCEFVQQQSGMTNLKFFQGDMLNMPAEIGDGYDLIVCSGVLYHVDADEILPFLTDLRNRSKNGCVIIDTHISQRALEYFTPQEGLRAYGRSIVEHHGSESQDIKDKKAWASFQNNHSFWPTKRSLVNLLSAAGFGAVYEPLAPQNEWGWQDRIIWVADSRAPRFSCSYPFRQYLDPDPRPQEHDMFRHQHQMKPKNPSTTDLY